MDTSSPIVIDDDVIIITKPIVSIDLTLSPPPKPKQAATDDMVIDSPQFPVKRTITSTRGSRISTVKQEEIEEGNDRVNKLKKARVGLCESRDSTSTRALLEQCSRYYESMKEEMGGEFKFDCDVGVKSEKLGEGILSNTLCASLEGEGLVLKGSVKKECDSVDRKDELVEPISSVSPSGCVKSENVDEGISSNTSRAAANVEGLFSEGFVKKECDSMDQKVELVEPVSSVAPFGSVKSEKLDEGISSNTFFAPSKAEGFVKKEYDSMDQKPMLVEPISSVPPSVSVKSEKLDDQYTGYSSNAFRAPSKVEGAVKKESDLMDQKPKLVKPVSSVPRPSVYGSGLNSGKKGQRVVEEKKVSLVGIETGDFEEEVDWLLVGRTAVTGLSTTKGRKLEDNEIVHFAFPNLDSKNKSSGFWMNSRNANAASGIVRFSTKRSGEIGRLPMEWSKCLIPLVNSKKVKVLGRCVAAPASLSMMQEIMLYISFYIHHSIFTEDGNCSWKLDSPSSIDTTIYPLLTLFKLLKKSPFQKAEFTPEELDSRKRAVTLENDLNEAASALPCVKTRKGGQPLLIEEPNKDAQVITESSLNKLVGAADMYNLQEMDPPATLTCDLRPYQKQALYWMTESEKGVDVEKEEETLHPCWAAYRICDERATAIYVNIFSGEATTKFPKATQMARGGILADAMGLGKTVMTISLILAIPHKGTSETEDENEPVKRLKRYETRRPQGGTLIVCPMALLSQWKDELETHSEPNSITVFVHYGGDRSTDPKVISEPTVVLTTYGVLSASYKSFGENSIFQKVDWYRVVLDEAHTIKSSKSQCAQAAFALSSYCRWCLTGTPLQNNLEDLYSLLCFLHVEPWCNWAWWNKLIQRPYENGDKRGLKLVKAILRPLMLRRTKDTKDKEGRPILVLPPTDIQIIECEQSEAEHDFYDALFKRSKVQFDQFVAQGKVLHNYANILELLLRLRQCCNHPFLVMRMCRECLLSSWRSLSHGLCPICRQDLKKTDLITCPSDSKFRVDVEKNWKESSKVLKLLECLDDIRKRGCGEKSIVFSQWTSFLDLLEIPMRRKNIGFLRFDGSLSQKNREKTLREFSETTDEMVLLMSLKAGGVGLNLTAASNVFLMDPWWNPAVEEQAIMRIHRIGQKRTVCVRRFIVKDTVEERMQQVQARKQRMIAGALTDEEVRSARLEELKMLFR
ncbi:DNA repair protein RAD5B-like isoform X2 [Bidens hawaiensis]|uniref:DNA repair protein RAD5B-like isoform X2 n=1 Tax=Bidens hawaiensis TaxID=980011 RepID=UPI00404B254A